MKFIVEKEVNSLLRQGFFRIRKVRSFASHKQSIAPVSNGFQAAATREGERERELHARKLL
jgi:hypothetical protein